MRPRLTFLALCAVAIATTSAGAQGAVKQTGKPNLEAGRGSNSCRRTGRRRVFTRRNLLVWCVRSTDHWARSVSHRQADKPDRRSPATQLQANRKHRSTRGRPLR